MRLETFIQPIILAGALLTTACTSPPPRINDASTHQTEDEIPTASSATLKVRYEKLKHESEIIDEATAELIQKDGEAVKACQSTHQECVYRTLGILNRFTSHQEPNTCKDIADHEKRVECKEQLLEKKNDYEKLIILYETSNACASVIQSCSDNLISIGRAAEESEFPLQSIKPFPPAPSESEISSTHGEEYLRLKDSITAFVGPQIFDYFSEEVCNRRDPTVKKAKGKKTQAEDTFFNTHKSEVEKCEIKPPRGLENTEGACQRYVLKLHPADHRKIKTASAEEDKALNRCLEKVNYQFTMSMP